MCKDKQRDIYSISRWMRFVSSLSASAIAVPQVGPSWLSLLHEWFVTRRKPPTRCARASAQTERPNTEHVWLVEDHENHERVMYIDILGSTAGVGVAGPT